MKFIVYEPNYLKALGSLFQEKYLEEWKAFFKVLTAYKMANLVDEETAETAVKYLNLQDPNADAACD